MLGLSREHVGSMLGAHVGPMLGQVEPNLGDITDESLIAIAIGQCVRTKKPFAT